jgi:hypothetical protein
MTLTAPNVPETVPVAIGNVVQAHTPAQLSTLYGSAVKTPTKNFNMVYNGHTLAFIAGRPFTADAALLAALTAIIAPVV